ncbi:MAG TPA: LCP family protein [Candidatus Dormibacteraeota bacterium]|nr:LCP family protein [Candidatus Dormibacteraeota bacterium]
MPKTPKKNTRKRPPSLNANAPSLLNLTIPGYVSGAGKKPAAVKPPRNVKKIVKRSALGLLVLLMVFGVFFSAKIIGELDKVFHGNLWSDIEALFHPVKLKGESSGRVNILLAGDSSDDPGHAGAQLTDSILLLSVNTRAQTAFLLSIPRDLWVQLPGNTYPGGTYQKINAANEVRSFSQSGYPSGGMGELSYVVQNELGIPVDYYGLMDYGAFKDSVDAVGGVTINVQSPDPRGLFDRNTGIDLPNGPVSLNGQQALNLARSRGDGYGSYGFPSSDFNRTAYQRQIFIAVAAKAKSLGTLSNPVKISDLFSALGNNFQTNLTLADVLRLIKITKPINLSSVQSYAFSSSVSTITPNPLLKSYYVPYNGQSALIPAAGINNFSQVQAYYQQLTQTH